LDFCSDKTKTVPLFLDTCSRIFRSTVTIDANDKDFTAKALERVYGDDYTKGDAKQKAAKEKDLEADTKRCMSARPFALVAKAIAEFASDRKDAAAVERNLTAVTPAQLGDPQCGELQTYSIETIGPVRRPLKGYDERVCELSTVKCPLVFSVGKDVNPAGPKNVTLEGARCGQPFFYFRTFVLSRAQSSFMVTVVWGQIGNILIRKTQMTSIFGFFQKNIHVLDEEASKEAGKEVHKAATVSVWRLTDNRMMIYSILQELITIILLVWAPKFNAVFLLEQITVQEAVVALWILPVIILWDEVRKFLIRLDPKKEKGIVGRITYF